MSTDDRNLFGVLGIKEDYDVDIDLLNSQYLNKQLEYHPDRFIQATAKQKEEVQATSSLINNAYETLKDPLKRAVYLLKLKGFLIDMNKVPQKLVVKALDYHEALDNCESVEEISNLHKEIENKCKVSMNELKQLFVKNLFDQASGIITEINFHKKLLDRVVKRLDNSLKKIHV
jgi:molecular chaperone HscB